MTTNKESLEIRKFLEELCDQPRRLFPQHRQRLDAPYTHGVYIIRKEETILHVGRTLRGKKGLYQRLKNHLHGSSSFTKNNFQGEGSTLRERIFTYQYFELADPRKRSLLEALAIGVLCPEYIGLGE